MGRPVVLSNGQLFVGLDENGLVHDFYYPYVGLDNLTNARSTQHKIGVWADGRFSWTNDGTWNIELKFDTDALVSGIVMHSEALQITLRLRDFVDSNHNALVRHISVLNDADTKRDIRLFMHQVFQISRAGRGDTALYVPDENYILDYKGRCCLLIAGKLGEKDTFDQYAVGNYGIEGKAGTFMDAEDGELSNNPIEHGGVDSVLRFRQEVDAGDWFTIDYWVVAADSQSDAQAIHTRLKYNVTEERLDKTRTTWKDWLGPSNVRLLEVPGHQRDAAQRSLLIIKAHCDERGSILASGDSSIFNFGRDYYCYCWPRDAAYALWPLIRLGIYKEARKFFDFARDTMHRDGYVMHKYQPDRAIGSTWHPLLHGNTKELAIQEDETAIVVFMMGEYYRATQDKAFLESFYDTFIAPCAAFMARFIDAETGLPHASYDLWEQKFLTSTYTTSTVIAGLETAAELAEAQNHPDDAVKWRQKAESIRGSLYAFYHPDGYFRKGFLLQENGDLAYDDTLDISNLYGPFMFAGLGSDDPRMTSTLQHVENKLLNSSPTGGVIRYEGDGYFLRKSQYKGNPWIVCTLWLAQYYESIGRGDDAQKLLAWAFQRTLPSGALSEQFDPETGTPIGVTPLVWSHAEVVNTILGLNKRQ
ncbi:MAG TPA: glycoside hydrolase family 15 protein [Candidatus Saccharimonadales bacterium]|nr:glycoside hydrolase family 15 protein [Candidatus Saccharimonadales bacterium]